MLGQYFVEKIRNAFQEKKKKKVTEKEFSSQHGTDFVVSPQARYKELRKVKVDPYSF